MSYCSPEMPLLLQYHLTLSCIIYYLSEPCVRGACQPSTNPSPSRTAKLSVHLLSSHKAISGSTPSPLNSTPLLPPVPQPPLMPPYKESPERGDKERFEVPLTSGLISRTQQLLFIDFNYPINKGIYIVGEMVIF